MRRATRDGGGVVVIQLIYKSSCAGLFVLADCHGYFYCLLRSRGYGMPMLSRGFCSALSSCHVFFSM